MMCQAKKSITPLNTVNYILLDAVTGVFKWCHAEDSFGIQMWPYPLEWTKAREKKRGCKLCVGLSSRQVEDRGEEVTEGLVRPK